MNLLKISIMLLLVTSLTFTSSMAQCAMCRATVESTVSNGRSIVASDLNFGIAYLLIFPYLLVGLIGFMWYRKSQKEHGRRVEISSRVKRAMS